MLAESHTCFAPRSSFVKPRYTSSQLFYRALLQILLAFDAILCPWHRFQTPKVDCFATTQTLPILARTDSAKCLLDLPQTLLVLSRSKKREFLFGRTRGSICNVCLDTLVVMPPLHCILQPSLYLLLPRRELFLKVLQPLPIHFRSLQPETEELDCRSPHLLMLVPRLGESQACRKSIVRAQ